ncbi:hypothetical protein HPB50_000862 [Hyalomma asiaticum]|uniref:Uncharacterized protein n=1 Tax=Hyalomma asiaticum TaxID=266040 RepID=A0ACB7SGK0_HYAAI|nr:hypothetical protein HPB50_000862 [Hyalomma asiaticum]
MACSGAASPTNTASAVLPVRKPRRHFRIHEDLCLLPQVAAAKPFENLQMWEVLRNVLAEIEREVTLRAVKKRVELLLHYFRKNYTAKLRK